MVTFAGLWRLFSGRPVQVVTMSDRSYLVAKDGSYRRLRAGQIIFIEPRKQYFIVQSDGKTLKAA
jgi:hypothetical protein